MVATAAAPPVDGDVHETFSFASTGLIELDALAARVAARLHDSLANDLINVTTFDGAGELVVRATMGNRTEHVSGLRFPVKMGVGGMAIVERRTVIVLDYTRIEATQAVLDVMVNQEGIRTAAAVPLMVNTQALGLLFIGRRSGEPIAEADLRRLQETSESVAPLLAASLQLARAVDAARAEERLRLATQLHEQIIPLLFAIGAAARRTRETLSNDAGGALALIDSVEAMASSANSAARAAITSHGPLPADQALILRVRAASDRFSTLTETPVSVGVLGASVRLDTATIDTLTAVVVEALNNVAKHAPGASAVVTLTYGPDAVTVAILDDGVGPADEFRLPSITDPNAGEHYGLASLAHRLGMLDGSFSVASNEDGGMTVRASVPLRSA